MKIGIIGTSCSGKTTLVKQLTQYFKFKCINECARNYTKNQLEKEEIQYDIFFEQIKKELFAGKNIITDRTIIDNYVYIEKKFKPKYYLLNLVRSWSETYDLIFLCKKLPFVDDSFRCNINLESAFISFLKNNLIQFEIIEGNKEERFQKAKKIIKERLNDI